MVKPKCYINSENSLGKFQEFIGIRNNEARRLLGLIEN